VGNSVASKALPEVVRKNKSNKNEARENKEQKLTSSSSMD
jgi:hypothetical protein